MTEDAEVREPVSRPKTIVTVEPGIFRRVDPRSGRVLPKLWIHYPGRNGRTEREPTGTTSIITARKLRAKAARTARTRRAWPGGRENQGGRTA